MLKLLWLHVVNELLNKTPHVGFSFSFYFMSIDRLSVLSKNNNKHQWFTSSLYPASTYKVNWLSRITLWTQTGVKIVKIVIVQRKV